MKHKKKKRFLTAIITDDVDEARKLLDEGGLNVNMKAMECGLPITLVAFIYKAYKVMNLLIERGADINAKTAEGWNFLEFADFCEPFYALKPIIEAGVEINKQELKAYIYRALKAENEDKINIVKALINAGAGVNIRNTNYETPLSFAVRNMRPDMAEILINAGADLNARNIYDETPLLFAVRNMRADMVEILIRAGSDVNAGDCEGNSAIMLLAGAKRPPRMDWDVSGWGPECLRLKIVKMLLAAGTDANRPNVWKEKPLDKATEPKMIKILTGLKQ